MAERRTQSQEHIYRSTKSPWTLVSGFLARQMKGDDGRGVTTYRRERELRELAITQQCVQTHMPALMVHALRRVRSRLAVIRLCCRGQSCSAVGVWGHSVWWHSKTLMPLGIYSPRQGQRSVRQGLMTVDNAINADLEMWYTPVDIGGPRGIL